MTDRLHLASLWTAAPCDRAGECTCPRCLAAADDPGAAAVLAALDATHRDLTTLFSGDPFSGDPFSGGLPAPGTAPGDLRMPEDLRTAILAATAALSPSPALARAADPCSTGAAPGRHARDPARARTGRPRRRSTPTGPPRARGTAHRRRAALAAALTAAAVVVGVLGWPASTPPPAPSASTTHALVGVPETGPLADPGAQAACLRAVGAPSPTALATRTVEVDGLPGVLLVLPTGTVGTYRLLVVDPACTRVLADRTVGR